MVFQQLRSWRSGDHSTLIRSSHKTVQQCVQWARCPCMKIAKCLSALLIIAVASATVADRIRVSVTSMPISGPGIWADASRRMRGRLLYGLECGELCFGPAQRGAGSRQSQHAMIPAPASLSEPSSMSVRRLSGSPGSSVCSIRSACSTTSLTIPSRKHSSAPITFPVY